ncbi:MAG: MBL fold metallo-hydrolase, partial [Pseudomonadota bacterium]|nr:MBL fold metallo-hydrolase [Pseudomonadota bacterium]
EAEHLDAILAAAGDARISALLCTHTHRDQSPGATPLAERTGAPGMGCAKLVIADNGPRLDESFDTTYEPERVLSDGEAVSGDGWTLRAVHTPGHTSNHVCFALEESGALFTGDHVMGWSTSVIVPPDGDMGDYLESLDKLYSREDRVYYPAHGAPVEKPQQLVRSMLGHRRQRERQILKVLADGPRSLPEFIPIMYKGLDPRLEKAAQMSVHAHLIDLERRDMVNRSEERWTAL